LYKTNIVRGVTMEKVIDVVNKKLYINNLVQTNETIVNNNAFIKLMQISSNNNYIIRWDLFDDGIVIQTEWNKELNDIDLGWEEKSNNLDVKYKMSKIQKDFIANVTKDLESICVPIIAKVEKIFLDGDYYEFEFYNEWTRATFAWWGDVQNEWGLLGKIIYSLINKFNDIFSNIESTNELVFIGDLLVECNDVSKIDHETILFLKKFKKMEYLSSNEIISKFNSNNQILLFKSIYYVDYIDLISDFSIHGLTPVFKKNRFEGT